MRIKKTLTREQEKGNQSITDENGTVPQPIIDENKKVGQPMIDENKKVGQPIKSVEESSDEHEGGVLKYALVFSRKCWQLQRPVEGAN